MMASESTMPPQLAAIFSGLLSSSSPSSASPSVTLESLFPPGIPGVTDSYAGLANSGSGGRILIGGAAGVRNLTTAQVLAQKSVDAATLSLIAAAVNLGKAISRDTIRSLTRRKLRVGVLDEWFPSSLL